MDQADPQTSSVDSPMTRGYIGHFSCLNLESNNEKMILGITSCK